ncbi:MAG: endonuclease [Faecousia sp.]
MKQKWMTRGVAMLLTLILLLSNLSGLQVRAIGSDNLKINGSSRHVVCTSLSDQAKAYYEGGWEYKNLSLLPGVDNAESSYEAAQNNALYETLYQLMSGTQVFLPEYNGKEDGSLAYYWQYTDAVNGEFGYQYFYADIPSMVYGQSTMQREHIWPQGSATYGLINGGVDLHHLRPSIGAVNNAKSDLYFDNHRSSDKVVVINDEIVIWYNDKSLDVRGNVKGDIARILLYVYCRWRQPNLYSDVAQELLPPSDEPNDRNTGTRAIDGRDLLLKWCKEDPVDEWEMERNDRCQDIEGNRNVFIDYPEYAWLMFGLPVPEDMQTPSGNTAATQPTAYTINAVSSNTAYGTVSVKDGVITADPKAGYEVTGYTILSGDAEVTHHGNYLAVIAKSNCTIQVNFAPMPELTVHFVCPDGVSAADLTGYSGGVVTLPEPTGTPTKDGWQYHFVGWTEKPYDNATKEPHARFAGTEITLEKDLILYPLYYYVTGPYGDIDCQALTDASTLKAGDIIVIAATDENYALSLARNAHNRKTASITKSADKQHISLSPDVCKLRLEPGVVKGTFLLVDQSTEENLYAVSSSYNYLHTGDEVSERSSFSFAVSKDGSTDITAAAELERNVIRYNVVSSVFSCYATNKNSPVTVYVMTVDGELYYTTVTEKDCSHSKVTKVAAKAATCTENGNITYWYCSDCGSYFKNSACTTVIAKADTVVPALGHNAAYRDLGDGTHNCVCSRCAVVISAAEAHSFASGTCVCGATGTISDYSGNYYIAAIRSSGNYHYMTANLTSGSTARYASEDSGLTALPASITVPEADKTFTIQKQPNGNYTIACQGGYLSWTTGNTGAISSTAEEIKIGEGAKAGTVQLSLAKDSSRILALCSTSTANYFAWYGGTQIKNLCLVPVTGSVHIHSYTAKVTAPTCTEGGYTTYTCKCGDSYKADETEALGHLPMYIDNGDGTHTALCERCEATLVTEAHSFVSGTCVCGATQTVSDYSGSFYIAAVRTSGNYQYMLGELTGSSTKRYALEDSGCTVLPDSISTPENSKIFTFEKQANGNYTVKNVGSGLYLNWTSGTSGAYESTPAEVTVTSGAKAGTVRIALAKDPSRILALNATEANRYFAWYAGTQIKDLVLVPVAASAHIHSYTAKVTAPTCTKGGYTTYTCKCGDSYTADSVAALGHTSVYTDSGSGIHKETCGVCGTVLAASQKHTFVNGVCVCGAVDTGDPTATSYEGQFYIAAVRSSGNYQFLTGTLTGTSTKRYAAEDSGLTALPAAITDPDGGKTFTITKGKNNTYTISCDGITTADKYLSWSSGSSGSFSATADAVTITEGSKEGTVNIALSKDPSRILALNSVASNNYFAWYAGTQAKNLVLIPVQQVTHTHSYTAKVTAPTCTARGYTTYTCVCGESYKGKYVPANGHTETCKDNGDGTHKITCVTCSKVISASVAHSYLNGVCSVCGAVDSSAGSYCGRYYIAARRSNGTYEYLSATLTGSSTKRYASAGSVTALPEGITAPDPDRVFVIEKVNGDYAIRCESTGTYLSWSSGNSGDLSEAPEAVAIDDGKTAGTVKISLKRDAGRVLALNSTATCKYFAWYGGTQITDLYLVPVTSTTYRTDYIHKSAGDPGLKFASASLTLNSDISINFYVREDVLADWEEPYVVFEKPVYDTDGSTLRVETTVVDTFRSKNVSGVDYCVFTFDGITAAEMGNNVQATLYAAKEGVYCCGKTVDYSVWQYVTNMLNRSQDEKLNTLLVDMLNYGAWAQTYFGYNTDNPVNATLTPEQAALATSEIPVVDNCRELVKNPGAVVSFNSCSLILESQVTLCCYLEYAGDADDLYAVVSYDGKSARIDGSEFVLKTYSDGSTAYALHFEGLAATQMRTPCRIELFDTATDQRVSDTLTYSVESYADAYFDTEIPNLAAFVTAMMKYGDAAQAYFN